MYFRSTIKHCVPETRAEKADLYFMRHAREIDRLFKAGESMRIPLYGCYSAL